MRSIRIIDADLMLLAMEASALNERTDFEGDDTW